MIFCPHFFFTDSQYTCYEYVHLPPLSSISSASATSQFLACQTATPGCKAASLRLWELCDPESIATLDLVHAAPAALQSALSHETVRYMPIRGTSLISSGSTLSPPPTTSSDEDEELEQDSGCHLQVDVDTRSKKSLSPHHGRLCVPDLTESMHLRSVEFFDRAAEVQFSVHGQQDWLVIVKHVRHRSMMHVVDLRTTLY
jgi:hypothetical protein